MTMQRFPIPAVVMTVGLLILIVKGTWATCPSGDPSQVIEYVIIPEDSYDRNYSSISVEGKRPLGYDKAIWSYNQPDLNPCIKISGASTRRLEIMFETSPEARLCINSAQLELQPQECSDAGTGRYYRCVKANADAVYVEFLCDSRCEEADVQFWYRLVLGDTPAEDPEDHWCEGRDLSEYPESLRQLPSDYPIPQVETTTPGSALRNSISHTLVLCCIFMINSVIPL